MGWDCEREWPWPGRVGAAWASLLEVVAFSFPPATVLILSLSDLTFSFSFCTRDDHGEMTSRTLVSMSDDVRECEMLADFSAEVARGL